MDGGPFSGWGFQPRLGEPDLAAGGVGDDARPGLIGFAERDGVGVTRSAVAADGFVYALVLIFQGMDAAGKDGATLRSLLGVTVEQRSSKFGKRRDRNSRTSETFRLAVCAEA